MGRIWAVARNIITEVLRMRFLMLFVILFVCVCTFGFATWLHYGSGMANEKIQTFLSYSLRVTTVCLSLLTVFLSIATISRDIANREIHTVTTKPISRGQLLAGKFLGIAVFNLILLVMVGTVIYGLTKTLQRTEPKSDDERDKIKELVLVARQAVQPQLPDPQRVQKIAEKRVESIIKEKKIAENINNPAEIKKLREQLLVQVKGDIIKLSRAVAPARTGIWHFQNIEPIDSESGNVYIRYKQDVSRNPSGMKTYGRWAVGPTDNLAAATMFHSTIDTIRTVHEFPVPVGQLSPNGDLYVAYHNNHEYNEGTTVIFSLDTGIMALYVAGGFEANFIRSLALIYIRLLFIGTLGLAVGAWLSFPVAVLVVLVTYVLGLSSEFILESLNYDTGKLQALLIESIMHIFPKLAAYDPVDTIEKGQLVPYNTVTSALLWLLLVKGGIVGLVGYLIFKFRELARVIV